ncbi:MAG: glycosyltransferase family 4 protein [Candidatus Omnitrophica bacterium]|nr:glycosyltransferase family 4 protein [Candidatus Omnitrophota bacterium]
MRILHLATHLNMGGIGRYVTNLAKAFKKKGHTVFVASSGGELERVLSDEGIKHIYVDIRTKSELSPKLLGSYKVLRRLIREENIDLIHAHTRVAQVIAALLSSREKVPYVTTCHGFFKNRLGRRLFGCWGARAVAISEAVRDQLTGSFKIPEERVALIHTGIEMERFTRDVLPGEKDSIKRGLDLGGEHVIGTIGRLSPVKGQEILIKAARKLTAEFPDIKVLLVGDGPDENRLRRLSTKLGLDGATVFTGSIEDTARIIQAIDVFVLPSVAEGLGLSLIEAMASGKACIASRVGGAANIIEDGVTGILVRPQDPDDLAAAIKRMFKDRQISRSFEDKARKRVIKDFSIDDMVFKMEEMYSEVIGSR